MLDNTMNEYDEYELLFGNTVTDTIEPDWEVTEYSNVDWVIDAVAERYGSTVANQFPRYEIAKILGDANENRYLALENVEYLIAHITLGNI